MSLLGDLRTLYRLAIPRVHGETHADRLESFYACQADGYDAFRERLLHGRSELMQRLDFPADGVWADMGAGTGANVEAAGAKIGGLRHAYLVDLSPSLLNVARQRINANGWKNVAVVNGDASALRLPMPADVITFSYSLTMIPDWFAAIDNASNQLRDGGLIGVADFFVSRKHSQLPIPAHPWFTRTFWPVWFGSDNVQLSPDHLPYLFRHFETIYFRACMGTVPYMPGLRVPYYVFIGRKLLGSGPAPE